MYSQGTFSSSTYSLNEVAEVLAAAVPKQTDYRTNGSGKFNEIEDRGLENLMRQYSLLTRIQQPSISGACESRKFGYSVRGDDGIIHQNLVGKVFAESAK